MAREVTLDVRGMLPPAPIERVLAANGDIGHGDRRKLIIDCTPRPLFPMFGRDRFGHHEEPGIESLYEITI